MNRYALQLLLIVGIISSCDNTIIDNDPIPFIPFNSIEINVNSIAYNDLKTIGFMEIPGGVRGIILYKNPIKNEYIAYERNCTYLPFNDDAIVEVDGSTLFMIDRSCNSQFNLYDGWPISGEATIPLRRYRTYLNGDFLTITDEPL